MAQPASSSTRFTNITAAGTTAIADHPTNFIRVIVGAAANAGTNLGTYVGTVTFHDAASATGTTSTSQIISFGLPNTNVVGNIEVGYHCSKGLLFQATGTPTVTAISED